jgi:hypothetical protein
VIALFGQTNVACDPEGIRGFSNVSEHELAVQGGTTVPTTSTEWQNVNRGIVGLDGAKLCGGVQCCASANTCASAILVGPRLLLTAGHNADDQCDDNGVEPQGQSVEIDADFPDVDVSTLDEQITTYTNEIDYPGFVNLGPCPWSTNNEDLGLWVLTRPSSKVLPYWNQSATVGAGMSFYGFGPTGGGDGKLRRALDGCSTAGTYTDAVNGTRFDSDCGSASSIGGDSGGPVYNSNEALAGVNIGSGASPRDSIAMHVNTYRNWIETWIEIYKNDLFVGSYDGDTWGDLFFWNPSARGNWGDRGNGAQPDGVADGSTVNWCAQEMLTGDFNGDGRTDLFCFNDAGNLIYIDYADAAGQFGGTNWSATFSNCNLELYVGDFNYDGYDDLYCRDTNGWRRVFRNTGTATPFSNTADWQEQSYWCGQEIYVARGKNNDFRDDLVCWDRGVRIYYKEADANGFFTTGHTSFATSWCPDGTVLVGRMDTGAYDDLFCWDQVNDDLEVDRADGGFPYDSVNWSDYNYSFCGQQPAIGFMNGADGNSDLVCYDDRTGKVWVDLNGGGTGSFNDAYDWRIPDIDSPLWP